jgi:hypothetical protein
VASTGLNLNVAATKETGEPNHAGNAGGTSVWWNWTAPASGTATIMTANSSFDTSLGVYTGSSVSALTPIASNNDVSGSDKTSTVVFSAVGGTTYRIAVDGWRTDNFSKTTGAVNLSVALTNITTPVPSPVGTGTGLRGDYYDNVDFTAPRISRTEATINLTTATSPPPPAVSFPSALGGSTFSARWTGKIEPRYSETYTFYTQSDDGVRLWVNGQLLVDNWTAHASTENSGTLAVTAGQKYDITMEYYQGSGGGIAQLSWACTDLPKEFVPATQLYVNAPPTVSISSPANNATFTDPANITINATAADTDGTISKVEFFNGATKLGEDNTSPFSYAWNSVVAGSYSLTARGADNLGATVLSTAVAVTVNPGAVVGTGTGLRGDYYDNIDFTALRTTRLEPTINLTVAPTPPPPMVGFPSALGGSTFSARWTGQVQPLYSQTYTFFTQTDDGVRLWVNGTQLVNNWTGHASVEDSGTITLVAGQKYDIVMEYYQGTGSGIAQLSWSSASQAKEIIPATQLYANAGPTVSISSPAANAVYTDPASITITAAAADTDGTVAKVEFYSGTTKLGEDTSSTGGWSYTWSGAPAGSYSLTARAIDNLGAAVSSSAVPVTVNPGIGTGLLGEYWNDASGIHFAGSPVFVSSDEVIDFAWGTGSPDSTVQTDAFSARWSGQLKPQFSETYNLYTLSDDGVRLYIDGVLVIDNWTVHGPTENSCSLNFVGGQKYNIVMEYFENASGATAKLSWSSPSVPKQIVPAAALYGP